MTVTLQGIPTSAGVAIGTVLLYKPAIPNIPTAIIAPTAVSQEWARLQQALADSAADITQLQALVQTRIDKKEAAIFEVHLLLLEDDTLLDSAHQHIERDLMSAERAIWQATEEVAQMLVNLENSYFQARATDMYDIRTRIIQHLQGRPAIQLLYASSPVIIIASDLLPSQIAGLDPACVLGILTEQGGPTSHTAIIARQLSIPALVGVQGLLAALPTEATVQVAFNGSTGEIVIDPDETTLQAYQAADRCYQRQQKKLQELRALPATTPDGVTIEVAANIARPADALPALKAGATGVGLFRTEFLFLDRAAPPSEEEQLEAYLAVLRIFIGKRVIIRTVDIGGDKSVPYLALPEERNPFLGLRGLRLCMAQEYQFLFRTQVRALLQAAQISPATLWIMFPMVCDLRELRQAKAFFAETEAMLLHEGKLQENVLPKLKIGIMIETPAAALLIDTLAKEADFFSIGTNDLAQYTLASDRVNPYLAELHRPCHPAVMRSIAHIVTTARQQQRWIGMCGEMAGDARASLFLLGLGINELSMESTSLNAVKQAIRTTTLKQARQLVQCVLFADSTEAIEAFLTSSTR